MIDDVEAEHSLLRVVGQTGRMIPLHATAVGRVYWRSRACHIRLNCDSSPRGRSLI
ncbi:MAG: hypothetical protein U0528_04940 [Anaerolineae bacterium]